MRKARSGGPVDVLLTHAPPLGLGDGEDGPHVGIAALPALDRLEPTWHLHGHIHPYGKTMPDRHLGRTTIRNVIPWRVVDITPRMSQVAARLPDGRDNGAMRDTGSPRVDAEVDFLRVRRHQTLSKLATWMRSDADTVTETLSFAAVSMHSAGAANARWVSS